jgi:hypothetical protein
MAEEEQLQAVIDAEEASDDRELEAFKERRKKARLVKLSAEQQRKSTEAAYYNAASVQGGGRYHRINFMDDRMKEFVSNEI